MTKDGRGNAIPDIAKMIDAEPWVEFPDLKGWSQEQTFRFNQINRQREKYRFYIAAFDFIKDNAITGDYYEFGCHRVRTFRMALTEARRQGLDAMRFYGFDSFAGLPPTVSDPSNALWHQPGSLATTEDEFLRLVREHGIYVDRVTSIKGYYGESLNVELQNRLKREGSRIAFACVDCDLYESAQPVFSFIEPFLEEGSVLYIDDLFAGYRGAPTKGIARAFIEFQSKSAFRFVRHLDVGWWGRSYIAYRPDPSLAGLSSSPVL